MRASPRSTMTPCSKSVLALIGYRDVPTYFERNGN
jgi:hypothetical protein